jgi:spore coat polysaccharide biosynthesis protein SpsF (cytidylyltransferase family)
MKAKDHGAQITCAFCKKQYNFTEDDLKKYFKKRKNITEYQLSIKKLKYIF